MAEEYEDLELSDEQENINRVEKRIKTLSEKVKLTSQERDELAQAKEKEAELRASAEKERDFYKGFNQISSKYQGANEYQDKIWEKVQSGYDIEDATISILAKEGKYAPQQAPVERQRVAGGSADIGMTGEATKSPHEMSQEERFNALRDLETKGELHL